MKIIKWFFTSSASIELGLFHFEAPPAVILIALIAIVCTFIYIYKDAKRRGKNGLIALLLIFPGFPFSLLLWFWLRPEKIKNVESVSLFRKRSKAIH